MIFNEKNTSGLQSLLNAHRNECWSSPTTCPGGWARGQRQLSCSDGVFRAGRLWTQPPSHIHLHVCDLSSKPLWALGCSFIKISFFPNSKGWLQNILKSVFHSLGLPELCAHLSYVIFLSICGFEVMASEMLTLQMKFRAKTKFFVQEIPKFLLVPHSWNTWKWIDGNWSISLIKTYLGKIMYGWKMLYDGAGWIKQTHTNFPTNICLS